MADQNVLALELSMKCVAIRPRILRLQSATEHVYEITAHPEHFRFIHFKVWDRTIARNVNIPFAIQTQPLSRNIAYRRVYGETCCMAHFHATIFVASRFIFRLLDVLHVLNYYATLF